MKYCPYCTKRLPFFNIVWQRLSINGNKELVCPNCKSIISSQGASVWASLVFGSTGGYLLGKFMGNFSVQTMLISIGVGLLLFVVSSYFTAPIRDV